MEDEPQVPPNQAVEEVLHMAAIEVKKFEAAPGMVLTLLRFHTPFKVYTVKLDPDGVEALAAQLQPEQKRADLVVASPADLRRQGVQL